LRVTSTLHFIYKEKPMSLLTWTEEFYPKEAIETSLTEAKLNLQEK